ncbi:hypothetical protein [Methanoculleus sp.]|uniref:hypothetical protein n=1 Tax=Methanoculleus sp. TaxID=90427 RepID=UPI0025F47E8A|nr:hypothetical protein [Methanoculleus sp.]
MAVDRRFLLLCAGEVLVVATGNLAAALVLQVIVLAAFLEDRRGYGVFAAAAVVVAGVLAATGTVFLPLLGLAAAIGCGYLALTLKDYRLARWAGGEA